ARRRAVDKRESPSPSSLRPNARPFSAAGAVSRPPRGTTKRQSDESSQTTRGSRRKREEEGGRLIVFCGPNTAWRRLRGPVVFDRGRDAAQAAEKPSGRARERSPSAANSTPSRAARGSALP